MTFENLNLIPQMLQSLKAKGYTAPTPIQQKAIPPILEGRDILGMAQTGTGKTAAFALPVLQQLYNSPDKNQHGIKTLILAPTRELAQQISDSFREYGRGLGLRHTVIYGGVSQHSQTKTLRSGVDILIATPGRLLDLMQQGYIKLNMVKFFVLDEVDRMLDMGFLPDIKKLLTKLPSKRQTLFFSATLASDIKKLADSFLNNPVMVQTAIPSSTAANVKQLVYYISKEYKKVLLASILEKSPEHHTLVFTRTKRGADRLVKNLLNDGMRAESIHGDKSQGARQKALTQFKSRKINFLVATDVASRGLDITNVTHVINYDLPEEAEVYVHRIGRTGRAGATGIAISFCSQDERYMMQGIHKLSGNKIEVIPSPKFNTAALKEPVYSSRDSHSAPAFGEAQPRHYRTSGQKKWNNHWSERRERTAYR